MTSFVNCGRCSFFLAGYRVLHGEEGVRQAAEESRGRWLGLRWDLETQRLVQQSYGCRLDVGLYHLEGCCPECMRRYVYHRPAENGDEESFRIALTLT